MGEEEKGGNGGPLEGLAAGFIGLGLMGLPMALRARAAGARVTAWNRSPGGAAEALRGGCVCCGRVEEVADRLAGGIIVLMLWDGAVVRGVLGGRERFLERVKPGTLVIDMGTTDLETTHWLQAQLAGRGASFLDAPVSGGQVGAREGTLSIFAGGEEADFQRARPLFEVLGQRITHLGGYGAGQITKLVNQVIVAESVTAVAEGLLLAEAAGVDPAKVREALRGGFADSRILNLHGGRMVTGRFEPGGRASAQLKDVRLALALQRETGVDLPGLTCNAGLWEDMVRSGMGDLDHSAIHAFLKGGTGVSRPGFGELREDGER